MSTTVDMWTELLVTHDPPEVMRSAGLPPDAWQTSLLTERPHRALVTCSRQAGKSTVVAAMALHRAFTASDVTIVAVSPTQRQSSLLVSKVRRFCEALGLPLLRDAVMSIQLSNRSIIYALPGSSDTVRGFSPQLLVIDEAAYTSDALYTACLPMLAATGGDLVSISTPNGRDGWFWAEWNGQGADGWTRVEVPYTEISRITPEFIAGQKASMAAERFAAEYECAFNSSTFGLFNADDLAKTLQREPVGSDIVMPDPRDIVRRNRGAGAA